MAEEVRIRGLVQGVGLRPALWRLAHAHGLRGTVCNDGAGVLALLCGAPAAIDAALDALQRTPPPLARITAVARRRVPVPAEVDAFRIVASHADGVQTGVVPDAATCAACRAELFDPAARRHHYAFANCTHCGPRLSITQAIPYDRAGTTMRGFPLCDDCAAEYADPADRRFHAQPIACPACGPRVWLQPPVAGGAPGDPIDAARARLRAGGIVAIKALGGFHLACDATNAAAVARLRALKQRDAKPFAVMARDLAVIRRHAAVSAVEAAALASPAAPIVVLDRLAAGDPPAGDVPGATPAGDVPGATPAGDVPGATPDGDEPNTAPAGDVPASAPIAEGVAPGLDALGCMLPSTPLHHLLLHGLEQPLVMTSGNRADEPQCIANDDALARLAGLADAFLLHDRDIACRVDDSLLRVVAGVPRLLRRARGYAPAPLALPEGFAAAPPLLAMGGELKSTFALLRDGEAILSHHIGDLEHPAAFADYRHALALYRTLFAHQPSAIAVDSHPDYLSAKLGRAMAAAAGLALVAVQHHHAHLAACLAENGVAPDSGPVLAVVLDGLGWGEDGTIWGGEFLHGDYRGFRRLGCLQPVAMPGGAQAVRQPWRNAYAQLAAAGLWPDFAARCPDTPLARLLAGQPRGVLDGMIARGVNSPLSSSCGRLFDALAAAAGLCTDAQRYEGEAGMRLEAAAGDAPDAAGGYRMAIVQGPGLLHLAPDFWPALIHDIAAGTSVRLIAARCHAGLADGIARMVATLHTAGPVALSGGVFQNRRLLVGVMRRLQEDGLDVLTHRAVPANDGGLALGQAAIAAARLRGVED